MTDEISSPWRRRGWFSSPVTQSGKDGGQIKIQEKKEETKRLMEFVALIVRVRRAINLATPVDSFYRHGVASNVTKVRVRAVFELRTFEESIGLGNLAACYLIMSPRVMDCYELSAGEGGGVESFARVSNGMQGGCGSTKVDREKKEKNVNHRHCGECNSLSSFLRRQVVKRS